MKEIEILVQLPNIKIEEAQEDLSRYPIAKEQHTIDEYFTHPFVAQLHPDDSSKIRSCLRIRNKGGDSYITYKDDIYMLVISGYIAMNGKQRSVIQKLALSCYRNSDLQAS